MNNNGCDCDVRMIHGSSIDIKPHECDSEIKANIIVSEYHSIRLWGQVLTCNHEPVANALLKLVKVIVDCNGRCDYQGIAHSISDAEGFYQFDLCADDPNAIYKVLVHQVITGPERIIQNGIGARRFVSACSCALNSGKGISMKGNCSTSSINSNLSVPSKPHP